MVSKTKSRDNLGVNAKNRRLADGRQIKDRSYLFENMADSVSKNILSSQLNMLPRDLSPEVGGLGGTQESFVR